MSANMSRLCGGLETIYQLPSIEIPKVYGELLAMEFDRPDVKSILKDFRMRPSNVHQFVSKMRHYIQVEREQELIDCCTNSCKECLLEQIVIKLSAGDKSKKVPGIRVPVTTVYLYRATVDKEFMEKNSPVEEALILFRPRGSKGRNSNLSFLGKIEKIIPYRCLIHLSLLPPVKYSGKQFYEAILLPSSLPFHSRFRTLDWLECSPSWADALYPTKRHSAGLIPLDEFNLLEGEFMAQMERRQSEQSESSSCCSSSSSSCSSSSSASPQQQRQQQQWNRLQKRALHAIVSGLHGPIPFILFGPPGTGKTVTLVEAIRQIASRAHFSNTDCRVLVCTPSNTAADAVTLKLLETGDFGPDNLLRLFSISKVVAKQNTEILEVSFICSENGKFGFPAKNKLLEYQVLVCTLCTSTYLVNGDMSDNFTHIFVDEAGQADELDTLIPIVGLISSPPSFGHGRRQNKQSVASRANNNYTGTRVVLAGDPKQLGPVQTCELLKRRAQNGSLIERLINRDQQSNIGQCHQQEGGRGENTFNFDKRITVMLQDNYRSHPSIVNIPSRLYYGGLLRASAPLEQKNTLCQWKGLPTKDFPMLWHSVEAQEASEQNGHSYRNVEEANVVCDYVRSLVDQSAINPKEIGIITPYKNMISHLREKLRHYPEIQIDSVERFQGSERRVIIISTVRSQGIGFLACDKRFNTAITRPKELLIVVGSRKNLSKVKGWKSLIKYCQSNNAIVADSSRLQSENNLKEKKKKKGVQQKAKSAVGGRQQADHAQKEKTVVAIAEQLAVDIGRKLRLNDSEEGRKKSRAGAGTSAVGNRARMDNKNKPKAAGSKEISVKQQQPHQSEQKKTKGGGAKQMVAAAGLDSNKSKGNKKTRNKAVKKALSQKAENVQKLGIKLLPSGA